MSSFIHSLIGVTQRKYTRIFFLNTQVRNPRRVRIRNWSKRPLLASVPVSLDLKLPYKSCSLPWRIIAAIFWSENKGLLMSSSYDRKTQGDSSTRYKLISIDKCLSFRDFLAPRTDQILSQSLFFSISLSPFAVIFFSCIPSLSSLFLFFLKIFSFLCVPFFH